RGIGGETNQVTLVERRSAVEVPETSKREVAERILDRVLELRGRTAPSLAIAANTPARRAPARRPAVGRTTARRATARKPALSKGRARTGKR
ncbi:MAG: hypothetical protein ACKOC6_05045, partial [bacterium]